MTRVEAEGNLLALPDGGRRLDPEDQEGFPDPDLPLVGVSDEDQGFDPSPEDVASVRVVSFQHPDEFGADAHRDRLSRRGPALLLTGYGADRGIDHRIGLLDRHDLAFDEVRAADEIGHEPPVGIEIDLPGRSYLDDTAALHHCDGVRQRQGLDPVVGHIDGGDLELREEASQLLTCLFPELGVQIAQGFIEEDHLRFRHQGPGQGDALLLTAAELRCRPVLEPVELHEMKRLFDLPSDLLFGFVPGLEGVGHVVEHVHVGPDGVGLEHHAQPPFLRRDIDALFRREDDLITDGDLPRVGYLQADDAPQQGGLAAAARAEESEDPVGGDVKVDVGKRRDRLVFRVIVLAESPDVDFHVLF